MATHSDVENWRLGRPNEIEANKNQYLFVTNSIVSTTQTIVMLSNDTEDQSLLVRLTLEELDALIVLLRYRRSLIDDQQDSKEAT